ncbi:MAG: carbamoyltransferase HypF [Candidatus Thorarchaeota archaeon]
MKDYKTAEINISGIIQGVGFRPYLFNLARSLNLNGYILNRGNAGVRLVLQGSSIDLTKFLEYVEVKKPKISYIEKIDVEYLDKVEEFNSLEIRESEQGRGISLTLPPDIAICDKCLRDMRDTQKEKYYNYPFIACAVCGPRFTTVTELPYDRERTTMIKFPFCKQAKPESCEKEYSDFNNRRFHAQTFACSVCGPHYMLYNKDKEIINDGKIEDILLDTAKKINFGEIIAIKGIGGTHLVCLADKNSILKLRERKGERKYKPFAVMVSNLKILEDSLKISNKERELLQSFRRPIVLLERSNTNVNSKLSNHIAPGLSNVGVMLPYSGIHYLLFDYIGEKPLIYTSGNKSYIPMSIENSDIFEQLHDLADAFLLHNRPIYQRADDSVLRIHDKKVKIIRRSRGYVPEYLRLPFEVDVPAAIATGPLLSTTGAILRRNRIFPTQHIGNVSHLETYDFLKHAISHMKNLLQIKDAEIKYVVSDAHPGFITTQLAKELGDLYNCKIYSIQHHYAHILALMAENNVERDERIVGIATDGVGYGDDGNTWGGEILLSSYNNYKRLCHLEYQPMIGGDRCVKYPARMAASIILNKLKIEEAMKIFNKIQLAENLEYKETELNALVSQFDKGDEQFSSQNIPLTSSTGRIFDTVSYLLGASNIKTYRGEPAMRLESMAMQGNPNNVEFSIKFTKKDGIYIINTSDFVIELISLLEENKFKNEDIAAKFQVELAKTFAEVAVKIADEVRIKKVGLTGGVAYNYSFSNTIKEWIRRSGLIFLEHNSISPGDAGISSGQLTGGLFEYLREN